MSDNATNSSGGCSCHGDEKRAASDPAYRRALWLVVLLNLGFGVIEAVGGFLAGSQALKADSLDFLGDGSITLVGLLALGWAERTRAKVALVQGWFLAALGLGVIGAALARMLDAGLPEAELMGGLGAAGLLVNINGTFVPLQDAVIGAAAGYLALWSVYWAFKLATGKEGMGYGDFKLLAALGAWLGWTMLPTIILLSSLVGALVGIGLIVFAKRGRDKPIPFGPYLAAAGLIALLYGAPLSRLTLGLTG